MHHSRILKRAFSGAHHRGAAERKHLPGYRRGIRRGLLGRNAASTENRRASQKAGPISELGLLHAMQIGNSEKSSAQTSSLISAAVGVVAPRCWSKAPRAFLTSFCRNPGSRSKIDDFASQLSRRIVPPPTRRSVAKDAHRRVVHKKTWRRLTPCSIDLPAVNHAKGRNRCRADPAHFDALRDERTGDENRLLKHFFLSFRAGLNRRIGK